MRFPTTTYLPPSLSEKNKKKKLPKRKFDKKFLREKKEPAG